MLNNRFAEGGRCFAALLACAVYAHADEAGLVLEEAERLALEQDPSVEAVRAREAALEDRAVAAEQLPDPLLKMGVMSLPTDSFQLGQEPMTQVQLGLVQRFPRGDSRRLSGELLRERRMALGENARDLELQVRLAVREEYLEVLKQRRLAAINREAELAFRDLEDITRDYYATGRVQQQDVLRAGVELARVQEQAARIAEEEQRARARLATWIGEVAWETLAPGWPSLPIPASEPEILRELAAHPRLKALHQQYLAADRGVELAEQAYRPEFSVDLTYGGRGGTDMDGGDRSDLLSVMLLMDLPLFTGKRQDRLTASSLAESSAAAFERDDAHRRMRAEVALQARTLEKQRERLALYESSLLPDAAFNAEASFSAYQAAVSDLTTLMRARITEFELQFDHARLQADSLKTRARLLYLEGESS